MSERTYATETMTAEQLVEWFNNTHPLMTAVAYFPGSPKGPVREGKTRGPAWVLPSGEPVVSVTGYAGGIHLSHVVCAKHATHAVEVSS